MCMVEVARYLGEFVLCVQWGWVRMAGNGWVCG